MGKAVIGFKGERALEQRHRLLSLFRHRGIDVRQRAQHEVVGIETVRPLTLDARSISASLRLGSIAPTVLNAISSWSAKISSSDRS